jgi:hypothetical protein
VSVRSVQSPDLDVKEYFVLVHRPWLKFSCHFEQAFTTSLFILTFISGSHNDFSAAALPDRC